MLVGEARAAAADWVRRHAPGVRGAFLAGSVAFRDPRAEQPPWSDVDVRVVVPDAGAVRPGRLRHAGALLDVSPVPEHALVDADRVAGSFHLAPCFAVDGVLSDPTGRLGELRAAIAPGFARPPAVARRCADVAATATDLLTAADRARSWPEHVLSWLFPTSLLTHLVLVAALRPPTVRLRYRAVRDVLAGVRRLDLHERLLGLLGCAAVDAGTVAAHLDRLAEVFDAAVRVARTPFPFSSDVTALARPIAIDGSRRLVADGDHREAVFWVVATFARCQHVIDADGPDDLRRSAASAFRDAASDLLGVRGGDDVRARTRAALAALPGLHAAAMAP
ncbi:hypothetical protein BJF78_21030 [Pseudonocardia sp. CNS-139]|nr:hypothetical protein BJF78_21030 [Pseudonocardia sp. CNS-139]